MPSAKTLLLGLASGAALMYFLDPKHGEERRNQLKEQLGAARKGTERKLEQAQDLAKSG